MKEDMSRNKDYQRLLNTKKWKELRAWKLQQNPLCEICQAEGYVRSAVDVHHIIPVESAHTLQEMEQLAFDPSNLKALCIPCHVKTHKEMGKGTRANHKERCSQSLARWIERNRGEAAEPETLTNVKGAPFFPVRKIFPNLLSLSSFNGVDFETLVFHSIK